MQKTLAIIKDILPLIWTRQEKIRRLFLLSFVLVLVIIFLNLSLPLLLKNIVAKLSTPNKGMNYYLTLLLIAYGVIWMFSQIIQQVRQIILIKPLERSIRLFCTKLFDHLHSLPMQFHLNKKTGAITNALERAQWGLPDVFWGIFLFTIPILLELFLAAIILCYFYGVIYGAVLLVIAITFIFFTIYFTRWASHFHALANKQHADTNAYIVDSLLNFASVKYFNNRKHEVSKCSDHLRIREGALVKSITSLELVTIGQNLIMGAGLIILTYIAGQQASLGIYNVSDFVLINGYALQFVAPLSQMGIVARNIRRGVNELSRIMEIYHINPAYSQPPPETLHVLEELDDIEFKNVSFEYTPARLVIHDINFRLEAGKILGIVGETGSGKSTISNLLFNFYPVTSGKILINKQNIQCINPESLHTILGIIPQDTTLFNTTIYENILFGKPSASKEEVEEAIELAYLGPLLNKLPHHYHTLVGERGLKLSGGEKQRIAIARVLLKRPDLYIFDEATSALDIAVEALIMKNITPILKNATSIIIAHRLSTVVNADEILVLHRGTVEERGDHDSLLKQKGIYHALWNKHK